MPSVLYLFYYKYIINNSSFYFNSPVSYLFIFNIVFLALLFYILSTINKPKAVASLLPSPQNFYVILLLSSFLTAHVDVSWNEPFIVSFFTLRED